MFLDASKVFDRVNHFSLFAKLSNRGIPQYVIRILSYWYENQQMCVRWGGTYCSFFCVTKGSFKCYVMLEGVGGYMPKRYEALRGGGGEGYVSVT